ncbi:MAG: hypothetical protein ACOH19_14890 [Rhodoglobus sp.]
MRARLLGSHAVGTALAGVAAVLLLLAGCASTPPVDGVRPLTTEEAQLLAVARFQNYDAGVRNVTITVGGSEAMIVDGWIDFVDHVGYGEALDPSTQQPLGVVAWNPESLAAWDGTPAAELLPPPADGWSSGPLDPAGSTLANILFVSLSLGNDRPDNPQLLQESDARWLRADEINGTPAIVIAGPSSDRVASEAPIEGSETTRYWIDERGKLLRFESRSASGTDEWSIIDFGDNAAVDLSGIPGISDSVEP